MFRVLFFTIWMIFFTGCHAEKDDYKIVENIADGSHLYDAFDSINFWREKGGLEPFTRNSTLDESTFYHTHYQQYRKISHLEESSNDYWFRGVDVAARVKSAGYNYKGVLENIAYASSEKESVQNLMTAIYHRFAFYSFYHDQIGLYGLNHAFSDGIGIYTFNMGFSQMDIECSAFGLLGFKEGISGLCADETVIINERTYTRVLSEQAEKQNNIVIYPYDRAIDVPPAFYEELPDPLPMLSMSGNPISIQFNPTITKEIKILEFNLTKFGSNTSLEVIAMDEKSDPNSKFDDHQFAYFPKNRLQYKSKYVAQFSYQLGDEAKQTRSTTFITTTFDETLFEINSSSREIEVNASESFVLYFGEISSLNNEQHIGDLTINTLDKQGEAKVNIKMIDNLTYRIKVAEGVGRYEVNLDNSIKEQKVILSLF
jgi:hypothetical protein